MQDLAHERDELDGPAPIEAATDDVAGEDIQGGEQVRSAVANVVMRALLGLPEGDRQQRGRPLQSLDLGLLVERQHHRTGRRVQVQTHDVGHLRREVPVARHLERPLPMRLPTTLPPQHRH